MQHNQFANHRYDYITWTKAKALEVRYMTVTYLYTSGLYTIYFLSWVPIPKYNWIHRRIGSIDYEHATTANDVNNEHNRLQTFIMNFAHLASRKGITDISQWYNRATDELLPIDCGDVKLATRTNH